MKIWEIDPLTFGETLRDMRCMKQMTQKELADRIHGSSLASIVNWEHGVSLPNLASLIELAKVFKVDEIRVDATKRWYI